MKKSILTASIAVVAIIIGISVIFVENNNDVKINDFIRAKEKFLKRDFEGIEYISCDED